MSESDKPLRQQIDDGMEAIRHQLERLRDGPTMGERSNDLTVIADLEAEYQALKEARTGLAPMIAHPMSSTARHLISSG
jgi:ribosomal protein S2